MPRKRVVKKKVDLESDVSFVSSTCSIVEEDTGYLGVLNELENVKDSITRKVQAHMNQMDQIRNNLLGIIGEYGDLSVKMESLDDIMAILNDSFIDREAVAVPETPTPAKNSRRRSRSLTTTGGGALSPIQESPMPSTSRATPAPPSTFKTPLGTSRLLTASKYTVRRPMGPQIGTSHVKRVMKAGEEAISVTGSPLFVGGVPPTQPEVIIPLENGVIFNLNPDRGNPRQVPVMDTDMKKKLKVIYDQLKRCIDEK